MSIIQDSKSLSEWIACCIRKHVKGDGSMTRDQCIAAAHQKFGVSKDFMESILREDAIPECVFARMECLEKKYPSIFTIKERLDLSYEYCSSYTKANDFGNGQFFVYVEDLLGSEKLKKLIEYRALKSVWEFVRTIGAPILYDKENDIEYEGKLVLKKHKPEDFLVEDVKPYYGSKIGSGETPAERAKKKAQKAYEAYKKNLNTLTEAPGTQVRNLPETPVSSSNVMTEAVVNNKLYLRFHSSPLFSYKYIFGSNEEALQAADELTKNSPGRYVWKSLRGKELGPVFGKPQKLTPGGTSASLVPYDKSRYSRIKQYMGRMPEIEAKYGSLEEIAESLRQTKMGIKEERAPEEETEKGELEAGGTSGAPFRPKELEKYQEGIYKEKKKRKKYKEEAKKMIEEIRRKRLGDYIVEDSMDELFEWVRKHTDAKDEEEVKEIAFMISKARQKKGKKIGTKKDWKETMNEIGEELDKRRKARQRLREQRKGEQNLIQRSLYSSLDYNEVEYVSYLEEELAKHDFYLEEHLDEFYDFIEGYDKDFDPNQKGHWITSRGKHIFIPEGHSLQFNKGGNYSTSKAEELKKKIQERGLEKTKIERSTEQKETKIKNLRKQLKELEKRNIPYLDKEIKEEIHELGGTTLNYAETREKLRNTLKKLKKQSQSEEIKFQIQKIEKRLEEIKGKRDFETLTEITNLMKELNQYDFHLEDNLDEFNKFQKIVR
ncbi:MAG: hypothetical protein ACFFG0_05665 [Candidatus Thorarchaeota archaeon]